MTPLQYEIIRDRTRFKTWVAGRRSGKTYTSVGYLLAGALPAPITANTEWYAYIAPTYKMAKRIAWEELMRMVPRNRIAKENESALAIKLVNGKWVALFGADNPDSLRGIGIKRFVMDEYADMDERVFPEIIRPTLSTTSGDGMFIGTPKGFNHFHDLFLRGQSNTREWRSWQTTTAEGGLVPPSEIEAARGVMTEKQFRQEYLASFETMASRVYHAFDRRTHLHDGIVCDPELDVLIGIDFNVNPGMHACLAQRVADQVHVFDEVYIPDGNTEELAREVVKRYGVVRLASGLMRKRRLIAYPDPTGRKRQTSAPTGHTDFTILSNDYGIEIRAPHAPYPTEDKINTTNAALMSATKRSRVFIHPRCVKLIRGLEGLTYKGDTQQPDKKSNLDHMTDAFAYLVCYELPMRKPVFIGKGPF